MNRIRHPMFARIGLAFALAIAVPACDSPSDPPIDEEEEEGEEGEEGSKLRDRRAVRFN